MAKLALQQLHKVIATDKNSFPQGREAVVLRNLLKVTMDAAQEEGQAASKELAELFSLCASKAKEQGIESFFSEADGRQGCNSVSFWHAWREVRHCGSGVPNRKHEQAIQGLKPIGLPYLSEEPDVYRRLLRRSKPDCLPCSRDNLL